MVNYKKYLNQDYGALKAQCVKSGKLFEDPEFLAENSSLYYTRETPFRCVWKRPKEIFPDAQLFVEGASSADVTQGRVGNCWFVAAAASLALEKSLWTKVIPDYKADAFTPEDPSDYQGIFRFRFWRFGDWTEVVIDDRLPTFNGELIFIKSKERGEFWSALLEKAYAKLAGSYEALESGNPADALVDFTGGVSESIDLVRDDYANDLEKKKALHLKLRKLMTRRTMCSASIKVTDKKEMEAQLDTGLVKGHAYGISAVKTIKLGEGFFSKMNCEKLYMVKLRNPWGQKEWNGAWSDGSEDWARLSDEEREELDIKVEDDGEFWMSWEDFCVHFTTVTICVLVNTSVFSFDTTYEEGAFKGAWSSEAGTAGGCINNKESFIHNPQYRFDIPGDKQDVAFVSVMQPDTRNKKSSGKTNLTIGFFVMKVELNRTYSAHRIYDRAGQSGFSNSREVFQRLELDPGRYIIIPSTFSPGTDGEFLIRVYTDNSNDMSAVSLETPEVPFFSCLPIYKYPTHQVSCIVSEVTNLQKKGASLTVDAYCTIECEGTKVTTSVKKNTLNPKFDEGGLFYVKDIATAVLKIQVYDYNALLPDTFLGEFTTDVKINNKVQMFTQKLIERRNSDGSVTRADGTIAFKFAASDDLMLN